jgi:hypothetical protein
MFRVAFDAGTIWPWLTAVGLIVVGFGIFRFVSPMIATAWDRARAIALEKGFVV